MVSPLTIKTTIRELQQGKLYVVGGSAKTHENLVEKVMEFNETIRNMARNWMTFLRLNIII